MKRLGAEDDCSGGDVRGTLYLRGGKQHRPYLFKDQPLCLGMRARLGSPRISADFSVCVFHAKIMRNQSHLSDARPFISANCERLQDLDRVPI